MTGTAAISPFFLWLLPALFLLHDLEETLFFKPWLELNRDRIRKRVPALFDRAIRHLENTSVKQFAAMAAEEFILLAAVTIYATLTANYDLWLALLLAFGLHLVIHLAQWLVIRRYLPSAITALLCLPVCIFMIGTLADERLFSMQEFILYGIAGTAVAGVNLFAIHWIASHATSKPA